MARLTWLFPVLWQQGRVRYPFSRLAVLHGFFQDLNSIVFLPRRRQLPDLLQSSSQPEAGTTSSPAATAVRLPSWYCFFHLNSRLG
jgi:hypothetical protein